LLSSDGVGASPSDPESPAANTRRSIAAQGDEDAPPGYVYEGARAKGETTTLTVGEEPKVIRDRPVELLGAREGKGAASFVNGDAYEGDYATGSRDGTGKYVYAAPPPGEEEEPKPAVAEYDGRWTAGAKAGVGTATYKASKHKYQGCWKDGKQHGEGTMFYPNGDIYTGQWVEGKKHGTGTYIFKATDTKASGEWEANVLTKGSFVDCFGNTYDGAFDGDSTQLSYKGGSFTLASGASAAA